MRNLLTHYAFFVEMLNRLRSQSWIWLLGLFTVAGFVEVVFWGQVTTFTPLYLKQLGIPVDEIATWTGAIAAISTLVGVPFLPFWGALADRYSRKPVIVRSFVAHLLAGVVMLAFSATTAPGVVEATGHESRATKAAT